MRLQHLNVAFFLSLLALAGIGVFLIFQPFLTAILLAAILAVFFQRPYRFLVRALRGSEGWGSFLTCIFALIIIIAPLSVIVSLAVGEANSFYHSPQSVGLLGKTVELVERMPFLESGSVAEKLSENFQAIGKGAVSILGAAYQGVAGFVLWLFVLFFSLFYFLIDGERAIRYLMRLSPLRDDHEKLLFRKFISISRATLRGTLIVGIIQGFLGGIAFAIAGIPSPIIWGLIMAVLSLIPMIGAGLLWFPVALILLFTGSVWEGVFLLAFGAGVISTIDNILRPKLVGRDTEMHPLLVFFATLGGIALFGVSGFLIGPIVVSLFMALAEIYMAEYGPEIKQYNHNGEV